MNLVVSQNERALQVHVEQLLADLKWVGVNGGGEKRARGTAPLRALRQPLSLRMSMYRSLLIPRGFAPDRELDNERRYARPRDRMQHAIQVRDEYNERWRALREGLQATFETGVDVPDLAATMNVRFREELYRIWLTQVKQPGLEGNLATGTAWDYQAVGLDEPDVPPPPAGTDAATGQLPDDWYSRFIDTLYFNDYVRWITLTTYRIHRQQWLLKEAMTLKGPLGRRQRLIKSAVRNLTKVWGDVSIMYTKEELEEEYGTQSELKVTLKARVKELADDSWIMELEDPDEAAREEAALEADRSVARWELNQVKKKVKWLRQAADGWDRLAFDEEQRVYLLNAGLVAPHVSSFLVGLGHEEDFRVEGSRGTLPFSWLVQKSAFVDHTLIMGWLRGSHTAANPSDKDALLALHERVELVRVPTVRWRYMPKSSAAMLDRYIRARVKIADNSRDDSRAVRRLANPLLMVVFDPPVEIHFRVADPNLPEHMMFNAGFVGTGVHFEDLHEQQSEFLETMRQQGALPFGGVPYHRSAHGLSLRSVRLAHPGNLRWAVQQMITHVAQVNPWSFLGPPVEEKASIEAIINLTLSNVAYGPNNILPLTRVADVGEAESGQPRTLVLDAGNPNVTEDVRDDPDRYSLLMRWRDSYKDLPYVIQRILVIDTSMPAGKREVTSFGDVQKIENDPELPEPEPKEEGDADFPTFLPWRAAPGEASINRRQPLAIRANGSPSAALRRDVSGGPSAGTDRILAITWNLAGKATRMNRKQWHASLSGQAWARWLRSRIQKMDEPPVLVALALQEWNPSNKFPHAFHDWLGKAAAKTEARYLRYSYELKPLGGLFGRDFSQNLTLFVRADRAKGWKVSKAGQVCFGASKTCVKGSLVAQIESKRSRGANVAPARWLIVASHFPFGGEDNVAGRNQAYRKTLKSVRALRDRESGQVIWMGDLNYRMRAAAAHRDQLLDSMQRNLAFQGFEEGPGNRGPFSFFHPTCKLQPLGKRADAKRRNALLQARRKGSSKAYVSKRTPSYCDRILVRNTSATTTRQRRLIPETYESVVEGTLESDHNAVASTVKFL